MERGWQRIVWVIHIGLFSENIMIIWTILGWVVWVFVLLVGVGKYAGDFEDSAVRWMERISGTLLILGCLVLLLLPFSKLHLLWWLVVGHFLPILLFQVRMKRSMKRASDAIASGIPLQEVLSKEAGRMGVSDGIGRVGDKNFEKGQGGGKLEHLQADLNLRKADLEKVRNSAERDLACKSIGEEERDWEGIEYFQRELYRLKDRLAKLQEIEALQSQSAILGEIIDLNEQISDLEKPTLEDLRNQLAELEDYRRVNNRIEELRKEVEFL
jgi:hypothetical protein